MERVSQHITYNEATKSQTAVRKGIRNIPGAAELAAMRLVAYHIFEPCRIHFGVPIGISSFFRSSTLNIKIGGSPNSQHCLGEAVDMDADMYGHLTNLELFSFILQELDFDQLIAEFPNDEGEPAWVHCSYKPNSNRNMVLIATKQKGRTVYLNYNENKSLLG